MCVYEATSLAPPFLSRWYLTSSEIPVSACHVSWDQILYRPLLGVRCYSEVRLIIFAPKEHCPVGMIVEMEASTPCPQFGTGAAVMIDNS